MMPHTEAGIDALIHHLRDYAAYIVIYGEDERTGFILGLEVILHYFGYRGKNTRDDVVMAIKNGGNDYLLKLADK